ncbi:MAG: hypothetical protein PWR28_587 [Synergistaceae bacterium]|nr:hypothetical protein [Synergistaceae bacterium]
MGAFLTFLDLERCEGVDQVEEERKREEEVASEEVSEQREVEELKEKEEEEMASEEAAEARPLVPVEGPRGEVKIDESVIGQIAMQALRTIKGVQPSAGSMMSKMGFGRKMYGGVRISLEDEENPQVTVDTYISVRYGLRIPDVAWDLQETIKDQLEQYTGYTVKAVNIYVQGIHFEDGRPLEEAPKESESAERQDAETFKEEG